MFLPDHAELVVNQHAPLQLGVREEALAWVLRIHEVFEPLMLLNEEILLCVVHWRNYSLTSLHKELLVRVNHVEYRHDIVL